MAKKKQPNKSKEGKEKFKSSKSILQLLKKWRIVEGFKELKNQINTLISSNHIQNKTLKENQEILKDPKNQLMNANNNEIKKNLLNLLIGLVAVLIPILILLWNAYSFLNRSQNLIALANITYHTTIYSTLLVLFILISIYLASVVFTLVIELYIYRLEGVPNRVLILRDFLFEIVCKWPLDLIINNASRLLLILIAFMFFLILPNYWKLIPIILTVIFLFALKKLKKQSTKKNISMREKIGIVVTLFILIILVLWSGFYLINFYTTGFQIKFDKNKYYNGEDINGIVTPTGFATEIVNISYNRETILNKMKYKIKNGPQYIFINSTKIKHNGLPKVIIVTTKFRHFFYDVQIQKWHTIPYFEKPNTLSIQLEQLTNNLLNNNELLEYNNNILNST